MISLSKNQQRSNSSLIKRRQRRWGSRCLILCLWPPPTWLSKALRLLTAKRSLLAQCGHWLVRCTCLLLTQSGHKLCAAVIVMPISALTLSDIKDVFRTLFPTHTDLHATMKKDGLWLLWQRRHLLVHKRGLVDAAYLKQTGDKQPVESGLEFRRLISRKYRAGF